MTPEEALSALAACRREIDDVDRRLVMLLNERVRIVERIGEVKQHASLAVYEPRREEAVYQNVAGANHGPLPADAAKRIFERIMDEMRTIQRTRMLNKEA